MSDMTTLMMKDPLEMTDEDVDKIIEQLRKARHAYKANPAATKAKRTSLTAKQKEASKVAGNIKLDL